MGKRTARRSSSTTAGQSPHAKQDTQSGAYFAPAVPENIADQLGVPISCCHLAGILEGAAGRLYLPLDSMVANNITPGELLLVGVAAEAPEPPPVLSPLGFESSGFKSSPAPQPKLILQPIRSMLSRQMVRHLPEEGFEVCSKVGQYVAMAEARPAPQLQRSGIAFSPDVAAALGRPPRGTTLLLHRCHRIALPDRVAGATKAQQVEVQLCMDTCQLAPATLERGAPVLTTSAVSPKAPPLQAPLTPSSTRPAGSVITPGRPAGSVITPGRPRIASGAPGSRSLAAKSVSNGPRLPIAQVLAALPELQLEHRKVLESLVAAALEGSHTLEGNLVVVPIASAAVVFQVCTAPGVQLASDVKVEVVPPLPSAAAQERADTLKHHSRSTPEAVKALGKALSSAAAELVMARRRAVTAAAGAAAAAQVGGGPEGPAAQAARRAAAAGALASRSGYAKLGGIQEHSEQLRKLVTLPLREPQLFEHYGLQPPRGVLLYGPPGCGKTVLAAAAAAEAGATLFVLNGSDVVSEGVGDSEAGLRGVFAAARAAAPAVIFLDEADAVAPSRSGGEAGGPAADSSARLVSCLLTEMDRGAFPVAVPRLGVGASTSIAAPAARGDRVVVIAATNRRDALDAALRRPGRFDRELHIGVPSPAQRLEIFRTHLVTVNHSLTDEEVADMAHAAHAFVAADLAALVAEAAMTALRRYVNYQERRKDQQQSQQSPVDPPAAVRSLTAAMDAASLAPAVSSERNDSSVPRLPEASAAAAILPPAADVASAINSDDGILKVGKADFVAARTRIRPSALREVSVEMPATRWDDVGGMQSVKDSLKEAVEWPQKYPEQLAAMGARPPGAILLYGPPGCSKTLLGRAVAGEAGLNFLSVKGPELYSKYVGESEKAVVALFARARQAAPAVVFLDELDGLAPPRSSQGDSVETRVMATLLQEMDGLHGRAGVTVVAATNRPDLVDAALLRAGRFDRLLQVSPPDSAAREAILAVHTRRSPLGPDVNLQVLADRTQYFTGADLKSLIREAGLAALKESFDAPCISGRHFEVALPAVIPTGHVSDHMQQIYDSFARGSGRARRG